MTTLPERDLEPLRARLAGWLGARLPAARALQLSALSRPSGTGYSNDTLLFEASWSEDGRAHRLPGVVRIEPRGFPIFPHYDVGLQFRILQALAGTEVPVPRVHWLEPDPEVLGAPFYVMERVAGRIPGDNPPYHVEGWVAELSPPRREALWWSGLEVLARIHGQDWRALGLQDLDAAGAGATPLERQLDAYERFLRWAARGRRQPTLEPALAWLWRQRPDAAEPVRLCWGDARLGNMIFRDEACVAVLDWEMAVLGSPEADLAWWLFLDRHHSEGVGRPRLPGFPDRKESVARYEAWSGHRVRFLDYYEVFAAFRFGVIMVRVARQLVAHGLLPPDSDFETDNIVTRLLARLLDLPGPGARA